MAIANLLQPLSGPAAESARGGIPINQPVPSTGRSVATALVALLNNLGIEHFFGVPGGPIISLFDALIGQQGVKLIEPRHESYGAFEAMGVHRASGRTAAVVVTAGPGATNIVTGIAAAHFERVPMIILCGDTAWERSGRRLLQTVGPEGLGFDQMVSNITRAVIRISRPSSALADMGRAVRTAQDPRNPGPVVVIIPVDRLDEVVPNNEEPCLVTSPHPEPRALEPALVHQIATSMRQSRHPLLMLGAGCRPIAGRIEELVDALGIPFMTTPQAKGLITEEHPLSLRNAGMSASWWARRYTKVGVDVCLVLGTDLDDVSCAGTPPIGPDGTLIHVDTDHRVFGRNFPTKLAISYDIDVFATQLTEVLRCLGPVQHGQALAAEIKRQSPFDTPSFATDTQVPIAPHRVIADLVQAMPEETIFVTDIGEHMLFALHYCTARRTDAFVIHMGLGSMATGIATSIGHALANPSRPVVCICGDGCMQMAGMEVLLALKHKLPVVFAIFNDARYNMVYHGHRLICGREAPWDTPQIDFVKWADAIGVHGKRIERPGEITWDVLKEPLTEKRPVVLDIRQDRNIRIAGDGRIEAILQMSQAA